MTLDNFQQQLIGKWQYNDGRILEFLPDGTFSLTPVDGSDSVSSRLFIKEKDNRIQLTFSPIEQICTVDSIDNETFIYTSYDIKNPPVKRMLTRVLN